MDGYTTLSTPTQMLLAWTLLVLLLIWLVTFAVLALRSPAEDKKAELEDLPTPSGSFLAVSASATLRAITSSPLEVQVPVGAATLEAPGDIINGVGAQFIKARD